ncbi:DUF192 domain-containing protein [Halogeometricum borinquense]|uniref:DUF192 domain-containing protein n=1 Tax=Halogeometricum borinquense TaxID=60847 RepID=A0A482T5K2_9EURY|nr:DUF192 domain-containing protein [Halogeometricum borinquense]RYJ12974.1 DUF192 domain-containing protein [Halogeometricum borinquense]
MYVEHRQDGTGRTIASDVEVADTFLTKSRGLMFRRRIPDDYALVFEFDEVDKRNLHMVFVPFDIDALWLAGEEVTKKKRLSGWTGIGFGLADRIIELPAGAADGIERGDTVRLVE